MTYLIVLITLLVVLAGVISYTGDVLGTIVGKRRLTLFGARPKRSGQIIGVLAGVLIMLVTMVILALAFRNATRVLFNFQSVQEQNAQLSAQQGSLLQSVATLEAELKAQNQELEAARRELDAAIEERDDAQSEFKELQQQQDALASEIDTLDVEVKTLEADLEGAQTELGDAQSALSEAQTTLETAQKDREQALTDAEQANAEVEEAQAAVTELETQVEDAQAQLETVQKDLDASQGELETARSSLDTAQVELEATQGQLEARQTELEAARLELDASVKARDEAVRARDEAQAQQKMLSDENVTLQEQNSQLGVLNDELDQLNRDRLAQITAQTEELKILNDEVSALRRRLEEQANALALAQTQAQAVNSRDLTYTVNQVVHTGILDAQALPALRAQFNELLVAANDKAVQTRAGDIILEPETTESVLQEALQTPGSDVVTLRSRQNQYVSEPLSVTVEVAENKMLVEEGQLVVTQQIHLGSPEFQEQRDSVRSDLSKLFINANSSLLAKGLADGVYPVTSETSLEIEGFTNQLLRLSGPVVVGLTASDDIYSGGPAKLEFIILN